MFRPRGEFLWGHYRLKDIYAGVPILLAALCALFILAVPVRQRRWFSIRLITLTMGVLTAVALCDAGYAFGVMRAARANFWLDQAHISRRYSAADSELGFVRKPGVLWHGYVPEVNRMVEYQTDENGFRNPAGQRQADIVFIGDSFTEAAQVDEKDTFVRRVAQATGLGVANLGRGAYGPQQDLIVLKRYGLAYKPRAVVWQLFEGNDLTDAEEFAKWRSNPHQVTTSLKERYFNNSLLKEWLANTRLQEPRGPLVTLRYHDGTARRAILRNRYEPQQPSTLHAAMHETLKAIQEGHHLAQANGIQLLVVNIPAMVRVMAPNISFDQAEDQNGYLPELAPGQNDFSRTIKEFCAHTGCNYVDSFDVLRQGAATGNDKLYIPNDEHLDVAGHEALSQVITDWLRSNNLARTRSQ
ncbi:MAG TPA: GDSL-type esterase/lipase family protein [Pyrinomonadaceae bacterium]